MEKKITFKQTDNCKLKLLAIAYFALLVGFVLYATFGTYAIVNFINSLDYTVAGLLGGIVFIGPLLLMIPFTSYHITVVFDSEKLRVQKKNGRDVTIRYANIATMYLNRKRLCELELLNSYAKPLYSFRSVNNGMAIEEIVTILTKEIAFSKTTTQIKRKLGVYPFITYKR